MPYYEEYPYESVYKQNKKALAEQESKLRLEGTGIIRVKPDIAVAFIGVVTEDKDLSKAQQENAEKTNKVIDAILELGIADKDIKTESFSITPEYDYVEGKQVFRGYRVTNNLRITIRNIQQVGEVIDTAVANGANSVYNVNFGLSNREAVYNKALSLAILNSIDKARAVEKTLNIILDEIPVEITEESPESVMPRTALYSLESPAATTTIKSGEIEVIARIKAIFNYTK